MFRSIQDSQSNYQIILATKSFKIYNLFLHISTHYLQKKHTGANEKRLKILNKHTIAWFISLLCSKNTIKSPIIQSEKTKQRFFCPSVANDKHETKNFFRPVCLQREVFQWEDRQTNNTEVYKPKQKKNFEIRHNLRRWKMPTISDRLRNKTAEKRKRKPKS